MQRVLGNLERLGVCDLLPQLRPVELDELAAVPVGRLPSSRPERLAQPRPTGLFRLRYFVDLAPDVGKSSLAQVATDVSFATWRGSASIAARA